MTDNGNKLRAVGGFADIVNADLPNLRLEGDERLDIKPRFDATIYIRFKGEDKLVESLLSKIITKLDGRMPDASIEKDGEGGHFLLVMFQVVDSEQASRDLVDDFARRLVDGIQDVSELIDSRIQLTDADE